MTREEAISVLNDYDINFERHTPEEVAEAHEMAIKALEERTEERTETHACDCISRQAVLDMATTIQTDDFSGNEIIEVVDVDDIKALPSVSPKPKTGHWIWCASSHKCSNCGGYVCFSHKKLLKYCPECGAKMEAKE